MNPIYIVTSLDKLTLVGGTLNESSSWIILKCLKRWLGVENLCLSIRMCSEVLTLLVKTLALPHIQLFLLRKIVVYLQINLFIWYVVKLSFSHYWSVLVYLWKPLLNLWGLSLNLLTSSFKVRPLFSADTNSAFSKI